MTATPDLAARRLRPSPRTWRIAELVTAVLLLAGAFLLWGPIGIGSGPLGVEMAASTGGVDRHGTAVGFVVPLYNSGHSLAVVDAVSLAGGTRFPEPRLLGLDVLAKAACIGPWPVRATHPGFVIVGCGGGYRGPLLGRSVPYVQPVSGGFPAAAEVSAPRPGTCWAMTAVVVRYHVGIRYYTATDRYDLAMCAPGAARQVSAAMTAAENAAG
jgi:hypothetical protein